MSVISIVCRVLARGCPTPQELPHILSAEGGRRWRTRLDARPDCCKFRYPRCNVDQGRNERVSAGSRRRLSPRPPFGFQMSARAGLEADAVNLGTLTVTVLFRSASGSLCRAGGWSGRGANDQPSLAPFSSRHKEAFGTAFSLNQWPAKEEETAVEAGEDSLTIVADDLIGWGGKAHAATRRDLDNLWSDRHGEGRGEYCYRVPHRLWAPARMRLPKS